MIQIQIYLMWGCLAVLGVIGLAAMAVYCSRRLHELIRTFGRGRISGTIAALAVVGVIMYGGSKPKYEHDDTLTLSNCWATNETSTVHIEWIKTNAAIPDATIVYIDYRLSSDTNGQWTALAESTMGTRLWQGTVANCTNSDYYVYSGWVPPVPVHTNGVWNGYGGVTKDGKKYLTINGKIVEMGTIIATPEKVRKENE